MQELSESVSVSVTLNVLIPCPYQVHIPEDAGVGATVAWVQASDEDSGDYGTQGIRYTDLRGALANK